MKSKYVFPAIVTHEDRGYSVEFPDLPGCLPYGETIQDVAQEAREALALHLYGMDKDGEVIPEPDNKDVGKLTPNQFLMLVDVIMAPYLQQIMNQSVKKTLTIPKWLDDLAKENGVNYSQTLQDALKQKMGIEKMPAGRQ